MDQMCVIRKVPFIVSDQINHNIDSHCSWTLNTELQTEQKLATSELIGAFCS